METLRRLVVAAILLAAVAFPKLGLALDGRRDANYRPQFRTPARVDFAATNLDGTLLIGGGFDRVRGEPRKSLAVLRTDGTLDPAFAPNGPIQAELAVRLSDGRVVAADLLPLRKGLFGLTAAGALDPTFAGPAAPVLDTSYPVLRVTADNRILTVRRVSGGDGLVGLLSNGREDPAFQAGSTNGEILDARPLPNGSTWVWGTFTTYNGAAARNIVRLRPDGMVDPTFASSFPSNLSPASLEPSSDAGALVVAKETPFAPIGVQHLVRLTATGAVASDVVSSPLSGGSSFDTVVAWLERSGGTLTVVTRMNTSSPQTALVLQELRADGSVERTTSYNIPTSEFRILSISSVGAALFAERSGGFGAQVFPAGRERLLRLVAGESSPEVIGVDLGERDGARIAGLSPAPDGRVLAWGDFSMVEGTATPFGAAVRQPDGRWDVAAVAGLDVWAGNIFFATVHPAGGWVLGGIFTDDGFRTNVSMLRLDAAGHVDAAWLAATRARQLTNLRAIAADPQGRVLAIGTNSGNTELFFRILPDGSTDSSFQPSLPLSSSGANALAVLPDGRIFVGFRTRNSSDTGGVLSRLLPDGQLDSSFSRENAFSLNGFVTRPDGSVVVAQRSDEDFSTATEGEPKLRLKVRHLFADGSADSSFNSRARYATTPLVGQTYTVTGITGLRDGRFLIQGNFLALAERSRFGLARIGTDGTFDANFRPELPVGPASALSSDSPQVGVRAVVELPDSSVLVAPQVGPDPLVRLLVDPLPTVPGKGRGQLANVSSRGRVEGGDRVMIAGFVVNGGSRRVVVRALGPSLAAAGVPGTLANPSIEIFSGGTSLAANDDWATDASATEVSAAGLAPSDAREAAVALTLPPGAFTAVVRGSGGTVGVGIVEVYILDAPNLSSPPPGVGAPRVVNLSTRAYVGETDNVLIGGFVIRGGSARVALRGLGPTLAGAGVPGTLADPFLQVVRSVDGGGLFTSDSWQQQLAGLGNTQPLVLPMPAPSEIGTVLDMPEGDYTVIISGVNSSTGIGMFEVYELPDNGTP